MKADLELYTRLHMTTVKVLSSSVLGDEVSSLGQYEKGLELSTQLHMVTVNVCSSHVLEMVFHYWASIKTGLEL